MILVEVYFEAASFISFDWPWSRYPVAGAPYYRG